MLGSLETCLPDYCLSKVALRGDEWSPSSLFSSRACVPNSALLIGSSRKNRPRVIIKPIPVTTRMAFLQPTASLMKDVRLANPTPMLMAAT